jgi:hypothetical protein
MPWRILMTHDELLAKVGNYKDAGLGSLVALRAVVQLHKPVMQWSGGYDGEDNPLYAEQCSDCSGNGFTQEYPCETIQAIEKELK